MRKAIVIIDMVRGFVEEGALFLPGANDLIPKINKEISKLDADDVIIHVNDTHDPDDKEFEMFPPHCIRGTKEPETADGFEYGGRMVRHLEKTRFDAFYSKPGSGIKILSNMLPALKIDELIIVGVCTDICIFFTVAGARMRDYPVKVPVNCVLGLTDRGSKFALEYMKKVLGAKVIR